MAETLGEGARVLCRYFNTPEGRFYGPYFEAVITEIVPEHKRPYIVRRDNGLTTGLQRKEIKRRLT
jgi:hypothetical protein